VTVAELIARLQAAEPEALVELQSRDCNCGRPHVFLRESSRYVDFDRESCAACGAELAPFTLRHPHAFVDEHPACCATEAQQRADELIIQRPLTLDEKRGLYAIIYGDNGATAREVEAARAWLKSQGITPE